MSEELQSEIDSLKAELESVRAQYGDALTIIEELHAKLAKCMEFLAQLSAAHEAKGKIQSGWKFNAGQLRKELHGTPH